MKAKLNIKAIVAPPFVSRLSNIQPSCASLKYTKVYKIGLWNSSAAASSIHSGSVYAAHALGSISVPSVQIGLGSYAFAMRPL